MPVIQDQELLYTLLSEGRLDLMYLPPGAIAWLWKDGRPEEQINAATKLAISAKDINPISDASVLKSDRNILILKCSDGNTFRVYPGGGYSHQGDMMDLNGCVESMQRIPEGTIQEPEVPCDHSEDDMSVAIIPDDGFDHMASPMPPEEAMMGGPMSLKDLLLKADEIDEGYGDQPRMGQYYTYDELTSVVSRDIQAHSGEDTSEYETEGCTMDLEGQMDCPDSGLPHDHSNADRREFSQGNGDELGESFDFSEIKKKS